jgi:uncharacterized cupin superfamily protein
MPAVRSTSIRPEDLEPAPIRPEWVIAGQPLARAAELAASPDGTCTTAHWDCTAGTFHWFFWVEETIHILEGEVTVRDAEGQASVLRAGDVAVMPANAWMVWQVERYVRKLAVCRYPASRNLARMMRWSQQLRTRLLMRRPPALTQAMPH